MTSVFNDLIHHPDELLRVLREMGLDAGEQPVVTPLTGGVSSSISRVRLGSRSYCLKQALPQLKVAKDWLVPVDRVYAEIDWLQTAETIVPGHVPHVIGVDRSTNSFIMEFLPETFVNWKRELMDGWVKPEIAAQMGGCARAHPFGDSWKGSIGKAVRARREFLRDPARTLPRRGGASAP